MLRTHTCGQLTKDNLNKEVVLCGWVNARRDHGKVMFIDLRDRYGITQIFFFPKPYAQAYEEGKKLHNEDVVMIKGVVELRPEKTINDKIPTGYIEVHAQEVKVLNACEELPFQIEDNIEAGEEIKLSYRYLDIRRKPVFDRIALRNKFNYALRSFFNSKNFLEVETPFLTKSTPEGARDFLVPSRLNANKFYALPQSPQLFKQLLMVGGIDRYYQIVKCFRDEDLRRDRQPEFTQLDVEMSFVEEEDIFSLIEEMLFYVFKESLGVELTVPFPRISHQEAMQKYGSDKPDLGNGGNFRFLWVVDFPLFEYNEEEKRWDASHHPFTAPNKEDVSCLENKDLSKVRAQAYDLVLNGQEIASGSIRIHDASLQQKIFNILGITDSQAEQKFGFLLKAFKYGAPPHGGFAIGLDRLYAIITGAESIRDVIVFPKTQKGACLLTDAPSFVDEKQLKELSLELIEENET